MAVRGKGCRRRPVFRGRLSDGLLWACKYYSRVVRYYTVVANEIGNNDFGPLFRFRDYYRFYLGQL